jgi:hypothetical protein
LRRVGSDDASAASAASAATTSTRYAVMAVRPRDGARFVAARTALWLTVRNSDSQKKTGEP